MKQSKLAARRRPVTRAAGSSTKKRTPMRHVVLLDRAGGIVRRCAVPRGVTFVLNQRDGHYYDEARPGKFVQRGVVRELLERSLEALIWCSGSADFGPGGQAQKGWDKLCRPLIRDLLSETDRGRV